MEKNGVWAFYVTVLALALFFNSSLLVSIWKLKEKRTSTEVLIGGLASGILIGSLGCFPQCLLNAVHGTYAYGDKACFTQAYLHVVSLEIQFISVAAISHRTYIGVVKQKSYPSRKALYVVMFAWLFAVGTTTLTGYFSHYYLVSSGTFCFYEWTSPALIYSAWPMAIIAIVLMAYWYFKTYQTFQQAHEGARKYEKTEQHSSSSLDRSLAVRLSILVLFFFHWISWCNLTFFL